MLLAHEEKNSMKNNLTKNMLWSLVLVVFAAGVCSAQGTLYFPQFVDGNDPTSGGISWGTIIEVSNPTTATASIVSGSITLKTNSGAEMNITLTDENGQPTDNNFMLGAGQTKFFYSPKLTSNAVVPYNVGYAILTSNFQIAANLIFIEGNANGPIALAGVPPVSSALNRAVIFANANTGVAVANPFNVNLTLTFQYVDKSGNPIASTPAQGVTRAINPNAHLAFFVSELFPSAPPNAVGTMRILSTNSFVATALTFQNAAFGTVPVFPFQ
jgi:hypothetical protein